MFELTSIEIVTSGPENISSSIGTEFISATSNVLPNETSTSRPNRPFGNPSIWSTGVAFLLLFIIGIVLNLLTILVICKYSKLRNLFVYFIFSLCVSDLISAIISPLFWYRRTLGFDVWKLPEFFCKFYWGSEITTSFSTAIHIMIFGLLRYIVIKFPFNSQKLTTKMVKIIIGVIWFVVITCGFVPFYIFFGPRQSDDRFSIWPACTITDEWYDQYILYQKFAYPLFLCAPLLVIVVMTILISTHVCIFSKSDVSRAMSVRSYTKRQKNERNAVFQLLLIVLSFLIGYIPFIAYEFWSVEDGHPKSEEHRAKDYWFGMSEYFCLRLSECLNPIFYNIGSKKMRKYTRRYITEILGSVKHRSISISIPTRRSKV